MAIRRSKKKISYPRGLRKPYVADIEKNRFKSKFITPKDHTKEKITQIFKKDIRPRAADFFKRKSKGRAREYLFKIDVIHQVKGKKIRKRYSIARTKLRTKESFESYMERLLNKMLVDFERYLARKDMKSISIFGVRSEVIENRKSKHKKIRSRTTKRSKRPTRKK